jgi:hypothetical protein
MLVVQPWIDNSDWPILPSLGLVVTTLGRPDGTENSILLKVSAQMPELEAWKEQAGGQLTVRQHLITPQILTDSA